MAKVFDYLLDVYKPDSALYGDKFFDIFAAGMIPADFNDTGPPVVHLVVDNPDVAPGQGVNVLVSQFCGDPVPPAVARTGFMYGVIRTDDTVIPDTTSIVDPPGLLGTGPPVLILRQPKTGGGSWSLWLQKYVA